MSGRILHIVLLVSGIAVSMACSHKPRRIPPDTMSEIYADMLLAGEWLQEHKEYDRKADTTLFYEPIFRKYGYTFADYDASLSHYVCKPKEFAAILEKSADILEGWGADFEKMNAREIAWNAYVDNHKYHLDSLNQIKVFYDKGGNGVRTDKKPKAGKFIRDKSAPGEW